ncbi:MAG: sugar nucleotide-binding protein, partial [bacterium]|nr:sugar nucleotide-binding protein [bacterium]
FLPAFLADLCQEQGKRLVHISTDYVYAGSEPVAKEDSVEVPHGSWYASTKLMADNYIQLKVKDYLIIRTAHKQSPFPFKKGYINVIGSFQSVYMAITQMHFLICTTEAKGVFNIGPKEPLSIYDYAKEESELPGGKKPKVGKSVYSGKDIPLDTTMDCRKFYRFQNDYYDE